MAIKKDTDPNTPIKIYVLIDPRDKKVRYVGWTHLALSDRFKNHLKTVRAGHKTHKCNWFRTLMNEDLLPIIDTIEDTIYEKRIEKEQYWISYYGRHNLTNGTDGGEGQVGLIVSEETRKLKSIIFSGENNPFYGKHHSEETIEKLRNRVISDDTREKIRLWHTGKKLSDEHKRKISENSARPFLGKHHTEESNEKNRQSHLGKPSPFKGTRTGKSAHNRGIKLTGNSSYIGVSIKKIGFCARVHVDGERLYLYGTINEEDTATAYDIGAIFYYGIDCKLNFPELREKYISYLNQYEISNIKELRQIIKNYISQGGLN